MASLISEVLQQLQKGGNTGIWNDSSPISEDFEMGKTSPQLDNDSNPVVTQPKRLQVPKACSNCRKMHAGCDMERPCRRCKQNGLESSCIDVPRKKRISRKKSKLNGVEEVETIRVQDITNLKTEDSLNSSDAGGYWEETYNELFSGIVPNTPTATFNPSNAIEPFNPYGFEPEPLILTEMTDSVSASSNNSPYNALSLTNMVEFPQTPPQLPPTTPPSNNYTNDLSFLVQQIKELHDSNRNLETKLLGVTSELVEMRNASVTEHTEKAIAPILGGWHSFSPQQELAISVWRVQHREGCSSNVLVEANTKFIQLLGYSMDVLRNNFVCTNMIRKQDICPDPRDKCSARDWPKRTQIITAYGLKDVFITITPIQENKMGPPRFFLVYILEVQ